MRPWEPQPELELDVKEVEAAGWTEVRIMYASGLAVGKNPATGQYEFVPPNHRKQPKYDV